MPSYFFHTLIEDKHQRVREMIILFRHFFPKNHHEWQDVRFGSVSLMYVGYPSRPKYHLRLSVVQQINAYRACWNYLKYHRLLNINNVIAIKKHVL